MKAEKIEATLGRIFMILVSCALTFIFAECSTRLVLSGHSPIERRFPGKHFRQPKPYIMFGGLPNGPDLNGMGYRGKEPFVPKHSDEFRIIMLGGSTVLNGSPPIAVLLEEEFEKAGLTYVKVYNFGVLSSVSGMELSRILFEVSELDPDLVLMYNGGNDVMQPLWLDPRPGYPHNFISYESNPLLESSVESYPSLALLLYGSNILRKTIPSYFVKEFVPLKQVREEIQWQSEDWRQDIADIYVKNLVKASKISSSFGSEFLGCFQPLVYFKDSISREEKAFVSEQRRAYALDMRRRIRTEIEAATDENSSLKVIDLSEIYRTTKETVFVDLIHTRQEHKKVVAQEIYRHMMNSTSISTFGASSEAEFRD